jgi:hypothetical protein
VNARLIHTLFMVFLFERALETWMRFAQLAKDMANGTARLIWSVSGQSGIYAKHAMHAVG